jgi:hypothetical protein
VVVKLSWSIASLTRGFSGLSSGPSGPLGQSYRISYCGIWVTCKKFGDIAGVGAENRVTLYDLGVLVDEARQACLAAERALPRRRRHTGISEV